MCVYGLTVTVEGRIPWALLKSSSTTNFRITGTHIPDLSFGSRCVVVVTLEYDQRIGDLKVREHTFTSIMVTNRITRLFSHSYFTLECTLCKIFC